ncbi:MAG: D-aminoacylase [Chloroflexota bacterium]|nr:D-aminoacylase [Chloroflexota bacterium]
MADIDYLIRNAKIIDGTGNPWFYGDVALTGDRIAAITPPGRIAAENVREVIDATSLVVCPGFIDILSHSIVPLMVDGRCLSKITQGVTTEIMGEGWTPGPFGGGIDAADLDRNPMLASIPEWRARIPTWKRLRDWLDAMIQHGVSPNIGAFLGGSTLREYAMGMAMGEPVAAQLAMMRRVMAEAMEDGAMGASCALIYPASAYSSTAEIVEVCKVVRRYNGVYITHVRSESDQLLEGIEEALEIGRRAGVPVQIYHLKAAGQRNWPKMAQVIELINGARADGLDVTADMYPYVAGGTGLTSVLPPWAEAENKLYENLCDPVLRAKIRAEALNPAGGWEAMASLCGPAGVMPVDFQQPQNQPYIGKSLAEIAALRSQEWIDAAIDLLISEGHRIGTLYFMIDEANVKLQLQQPWIKIGTDAGGLDPAWAKSFGPCHPRAYGTYPRILGKYVREEGIISLEEAIRKMSSAVADRLGLRERGLLRTGLFADVVLFEPATIQDRATFADPHQLSVGVRDVWVNGVRVLDNGIHTGAKPGRIVEGPGRT